MGRKFSVVPHCAMFQLATNDPRTGPPENHVIHPKILRPPAQAKNKMTGLLKL